MNDLENLSEEGLEDKLWHLGLNSHNLPPAEIKNYITFLIKNNNRLSSKLILNSISYLMHSYFFCMEEEDKEKCIDLLTNISLQTLNNFGDIFDILGILYKKTPPAKRKTIFNYILNNSAFCLSSPSALISICNSFSYIFDELHVDEKYKLINKLEELMAKSSYPHLKDTFLFTLNLFKEDYPYENSTCNS